MFETHDALLAALLSLEFDDDELPVPEDQKRGILSRIFSAAPGDAPLKFPADLATALVALARPGKALNVINQGEEPALGASKIGGLPDLPTGMAWPIRPPWTDRADGYRADAKAPDSKWSWATPEQAASFRKAAAERVKYVEAATPLPFLGQFNFAELNGDGYLPDMPRNGILYVFYDLLEQPWGFDPEDAPGSHLIWHPATDGLTRAPLPSALKGFSEFNEAAISPRALTPKNGFFPMGWQEDPVQSLDLPDAVSDAYSDWVGEQDFAEESGETVIQHRLGGHPRIVQNAMQTECALVSAGKYCGNGDAYHDPANAAILNTAADWVLLLQIDSDEGEGGYMWGDSGCLYVWIERERLAARDFSRAQVILQCY